MRKFLVFFAILFGITYNAMADSVQHQNSTGDTCVKVSEDGTRIRFYFDTGSQTEIKMKSGCESIFKERINELKGQVANIDKIVMISSADSQGNASGFDNTDLSLRREKYIGELFGEDFPEKQIISYLQGDAEAKYYAEKVGDSDQDYRRVDLIVVWKTAYCSSDVMKKVNSWADKVKDNAKAQKLIADLNKICSKAEESLYASENKEYEEKLAELAELMQTNGFHGEAAEIYYYALKGMIAELDRSVWRNTKGGFNTARLASDSIAGVVLGTAGGLITSRLVKKAQVKQGFEDIQCTIGGQKVADWHDEFTVGVK